MVSVTSRLWLKAEQATIWQDASADIESFFGSLDLASPVQARNAVLAEAPVITTVYGEQTAVTAADWYDELRYTERAPGRFRAIMADPVPSEFVRRRMRYGAGHLFSSTPDLFLPFMLDALQEYVLQPGRDTIQQSAIEDPNARGWQRITSSGACDFCVMLAGRGGVYMRKTATFAAHGNCNCSAAPTWAPDAKEVPASAYTASKKMGSLRRRAAEGDKQAQSLLEDNRANVRRILKQM